jgi:HK97 family phage major capsid protein
MSLSVSAQIELRDVVAEMETLSALPSLTGQQKTRFGFLLSRASVLKSGAISDEVRQADAAKLAKEFGFSMERPTEEQRAKTEEIEEFRQFIQRGTIPERRTYAPLDSLDGALGGYLCPVSFQSELFKGINTIEPLFDETNVRFIRTTTGRSLVGPGIDLSSMSASIIAQNTQIAPLTNPTISKTTWGAFTYKTSPIAVTLEIEQDAFESMANEVIRDAFSVGFATGIGADLISGNGTTAPQGIVTAATDSTITTASSSAITADEILSVYFALPRIHRANPKTAWIFSDEQYQIVRKAVDGNQRPLLNMADDGEKLLGKKVLVSPALASGSKFALANLSQYCVRVATESVRVQRAAELPSYVERGVALLTASMRVDAKLVQPASTVSPAVFGTFHS